MSEDGDTGGGDFLDRRGHFGAAFELDGVYAAGFYHGDCGLEGLIGGDFVGAHGEVADLV